METSSNGSGSMGKVWVDKKLVSEGLKWTKCMKMDKTGIWIDGVKTISWTKEQNYVVENMKMGGGTINMF